MTTRAARSLPLVNPSRRWWTFCGAAIALALFVALVAMPVACAQTVSSPQVAQQTDYQATLQRIKQDKAGYAAAIVARWQQDAKASGKWDPDYAAHMLSVLMKLGAENLLAAGQATSYEGMLTVLAQGSLALAPRTLGDTADDLVYTPINPCRIMDTRLMGSPVVAGTTQPVDVDNPSGFGFQGGNAGPCPGMPFGVARAVAVNITATQGTGVGWFTAWSYCDAKPASSTLNFAPGQNIANGVIVPDCPGSFSDIQVYAGQATAHLLIDLVGYFAAPVATALDCVDAATTYPIPLGSTYLVYSPQCPAGYTVTGGGLGGGTDSGSLYSWISTTERSSNGWRCGGYNNGNGTLLAYCEARCCRIPGR